MNKFSSKIFHTSIINILFHLANIKKKLKHIYDNNFLIKHNQLLL